MNDDVLLPGFAFTGFRSFGTDALQRIGPMSKVHLLAGPNNSGKSNVLTFARQVLPTLRRRNAGELQDVDTPLAAETQPPPDVRVAIPVHLPPEQLAEIFPSDGRRLAPSLDHLLRRSTLADADNDVIWFELERRRPAVSTSWAPSPGAVAALVAAGSSDVPRLERLSAQLTSISSGNPTKDVERVLEWMHARLAIAEGIPPVASIGAFRQISARADGGSAGDEHDGGGLIERLARIQHPRFSEQADRERFVAINQFVQTLFDDEHAALEIPHDGETILVQHAGQMLPLENYGTGLHQVIILAAAATVLSRHLVCVEEPEIHLHPTLQRKLLRYLVERTDNQYLIATHSAHLLDAARASISAVRLESGNTRVTRAIAPAEVAELSAELGMRASDLVQSNAVIWVEGPSDRVYIRHWLRDVAPHLTEGIDYSIMFYGGSSLTHLSPEDPAVEDFISLPRLNRNFAVVIDSDRTSAETPPNETKLRIEQEVQAASRSAAVWITKGYTIESYVPAPLLAEAIAVVHPRARFAWSGDPYVNPLGPESVHGRSSAVDKTAIAQEVVERWPAAGEWPLDLREQTERLAQMLTAANADP